MTTKEIQEVLKLHNLWLAGDVAGAKADLRGADMSWAYLSGANLSRADLSGADLSGANLDYSCWDLSCKTISVKIDRRIAAQLAYHLLAIWPEERKGSMLKLANEFHRIPECKKLRPSRAKQ